MTTETCARRLTRETASLIKGMIARGDAARDIAVWFGINVWWVAAVASGSVHPNVEPAPSIVLPPPGPYAQSPRAYAALAAVAEAEHQLMNEAASR